MRSAILRPIARNAPESSAEVELAPRHPTDLLPALTCQDQQSDDPAVIIIATRAPDCRKLIVAQHTVTRSLIGGSVGPDHWIRVGKPLAHRPIVKCGKRDTRSVRSNRPVL